MGRAAAFALATDPFVTELTLVDRDRGRAVELARWLAEYGTCPLHVTSGLEDALPGRDAAALAIPWADTRAAICSAGVVPVAAITRPPTDEIPGLDAEFRARNSTALLPLGLEPGLTELLAVDVAQRLDRVEALEICCGGVPERPRDPLGHVAFFGGENEHHLPIAQREALALRGGRLVRYARFSGVETREIDGVGRLEAYHDGMVPWLAEHPVLRGVDCTQKTLRWPGFAQAVTGLARLGLLAEEAVDVDGVVVPPKRVVERVLAPQVRAHPGDRDLVVLEVTAHGRLTGRPVILRSTVLATADEATGLSAMARATGFALAGATRLLADRVITGTGWRKPHCTLSTGLFEQLMRSLIDRGITWIPAEEVR